MTPTPTPAARRGIVRAAFGPLAVCFSVACNSSQLPNGDSDARGADAAASDGGADAASGNAPDAGDATHQLGPRAPGAVFVHLFEWRWTDVARECEQYLGPAGFAAVQVSPPSEHAVLPGFPWWQRYQTVGYSLAKSRSGTDVEFRDMVRRCAAAGVAIYVDAVINHMTAQPSGVGSDGTAYTKYSYPNLYGPTDFHMPPCVIADSDYQDAPDRVRTCELLGLADLDTSAQHVRDEIAAYLSTLVELGVRGFRVDAAKHIDPSDLDAILQRVGARVGASALPYYFFEVIDHGGEAIAASSYLAVGPGAAEQVDVTEFNYSVVADAFRGVGGKTLADLQLLEGPTGGLLPSDRAVVFVNNHDTQRASSLFYQDGARYDLATVFMLTRPYGTPSILSSFAFDRSTPAGRDSGPPSDALGQTLPVYAAGSDTPSCSPDPVASTGGWLCEHRRPFIPRLLAFRKATASAPDVTNRWSDGANAIAYGRGLGGSDRGFVVLNAGAAPLHRTFSTTLSAGGYCDVYQGAPTATGCSAVRVDVDGSGAADITVAPASAIVLYVGAQAAHLTERP